MTKKRRRPALAARIFTMGASLSAALGLLTGLRVWGRGPAIPSAVTEPQPAPVVTRGPETIIVRIVRRHHAATNQPAPRIVRRVVRRSGGGSSNPAPAPRRVTTTSKAS